MSNKLVIIDGNSLFYRSFYALPLLSNSDGEYSNAVYGFAIQIVHIINDIKPTHIAVAFDAGKHTFRNDMYDGYKATRKPMPTELKGQIEPLKKMLKLMNIEYVEKLGYEGDDIVGTLAKRFSDTETIIVTADRDTLQLIDDTTKVYFTKKGTSELYVVDSAVLMADYGLKPSQIIDLKALQGDMSDNIPGVSGIGDKTATKLLQTYGSLDGIYAHIDELSGKQKEYLVAGKESAYLSYRLATIKTDVDLDCSLDSCKYVFPFNKDTYEFFKHYEFKSLLKRQDLFEKSQETTQEISQKQILDTVNVESIDDFLVSVSKFDEIAYFYDDKNWYFSNGKTEYVVNNILLLPNNIEKLASLFKKTLILFDSKSTRHYLQNYNINIVGEFFDVSIAKHLVDGASVKSADSILLDETDKKTPASIIFDLKQEYLPKLKAQGMYNLYKDVELPLSVVLFDMENTGFKIDEDVLNNLSKQYSEELKNLEKQIYEECGETFNINSPKQLAEVLYEKLGLKHGKKMSTSAEKLEALADAHPVIPIILRYRKIAKLNSTYIEGFRPHLDSSGLVHTNFKQTMTNTGRLSSTEPNLQNIPIRSEDGKVVRSMFVASSYNNVLIDADYSQIELRLMAHMSGDEYFIDAFKNNEDIHTRTASMVFGVPFSEVTKDMRRVAKVVNFGIIYGISEYGLSTDLNIKPYEAKKLIDNFYNQHPKVKDFMERQVALAKETGRVVTLFGRSRAMTEINSSNYMVRSMAERAAQNMPLQGSAADIVKIAMVKVYNTLKENNLKAKLILQVHDELIVDCPISEQEQVKNIVKNAMENAVELSVPLTVDVTSSYRWSDGH